MPRLMTLSATVPARLLLHGEVDGSHAARGEEALHAVRADAVGHDLDGAIASAARGERLRGPVEERRVRPEHSLDVLAQVGVAGARLVEDRAAQGRLARARLPEDADDLSKALRSHLGSRFYRRRPVIMPRQCPRILSPARRTSWRT